MNSPLKRKCGAWTAFFQSKTTTEAKPAPQPARCMHEIRRRILERLSARIERQRHFSSGQAAGR